MNRHSNLLLTAAVTLSLAACQTDDSMPAHVQGRSTLIPNQNAESNAYQRSLEQKQNTLPLAGPETPGREAPSPSASAAPKGSDGRVLTLQSTPANTPANNASASAAPSSPIRGFSGPDGWDAFGHTVGPVNVYNSDPYPGLVPHLPANPGTSPMAGSTPAPDGDWSIPHSWGQGLVLQNYPHRPWPEVKGAYKSAEVPHNPTYYFTLQDKTDMTQNDGTTRGEATSALIEIPWFFLNTLALPVLMVLEPPLALRVTTSPSVDPNFRGSLPDGPVVPAPIPGVIKWEYPFMNPDGTIKPTSSGSTTAPGR